MRGIPDIKVKDVMTTDVVTVQKDLSLRELKRLFEKYDYNSFPVMDGEELVGVVTKLDFLHVFDFISSYTMIPDVRKIFARAAGDIMSMPIIAVCPEDSILKAAKRMRINGVRSIVVTDEKMKRLKGIVSRGDIVKCVEISEDTKEEPGKDESD